MISLAAMRCALILSVLLTGLPDAPAHATLVRHGIVVRLLWEGRTVLVTAAYDGGGPAIGASVSVFAPGDEEARQTGRANGAGQFAFAPDRTGEWRVMVDDGTGHRRTARLQVVLAGEERSAPVEATSPPDDLGNPHPDPEDALALASDARDPARPWKVLAGLGLIFGVTGTAWGWSLHRTRAGE